VKLRESRHVKVARIIYAQTQAVFPKYSHRFSPKKFTLPQLAACVRLCFYFNVSSDLRESEQVILSAHTRCRHTTYELTLPSIIL